MLLRIGKSWSARTSPSVSQGQETVIKRLTHLARWFFLPQVALSRNEDPRISRCMPFILQRAFARTSNTNYRSPNC